MLHLSSLGGPKSVISLRSVIPILFGISISCHAMPPSELLLGTAEISADAMCVHAEPFEYDSESTASHLLLCDTLKNLGNNSMTASEFCSQIGGGRPQADCQIAHLELLEVSIKSNIELLSPERKVEAERVVMAADKLANSLCIFLQISEESKAMWNATDVGIIGLACKVRIKESVLEAIVGAAPGLN